MMPMLLVRMMQYSCEQNSSKAVMQSLSARSLVLPNTTMSHIVIACQQLGAQLRPILILPNSSLFEPTCFRDQYVMYQLNTWLKQESSKVIAFVCRVGVLLSCACCLFGTLGNACLSILDNITSLYSLRGIVHWHHVLLLKSALRLTLLHTCKGPSA